MQPGFFVPAGRGPASITQAGIRRDRIGLLMLWAIVTAYNLFKPYHIDDTVHLEIAQWISLHPFHPMSGLLNWNGTDEPISKTNQPHLYFYLIAIWGAAFGYSEPAMHMLQSLFALACIVLFHRLARLVVGPAALWTTTMLVLGPAFIVEQNMMVDVPLLATWLAFFNVLVCDIDSPNQDRRYLLAGLACAAALLIKYSSLILFPILCVSLLLERRRSQAWTVLIPIAALAAWSLFNVMDYGGIHIATRLAGGHRHGRFRIPEEAVAWVITIGALTPLGLMTVILASRTLARMETLIHGVVWAGAAATMLLVVLGMLSGIQSYRLLWATFIVNGLLVCLVLLADILAAVHLRFWRPDIARACGPMIYLLLWLIGTTAFYVLFAPSIAARHVLLILPPTTLFLVARLGRPLTRSSKIFGLVSTMILSIGLCLSDWNLAEFYRQEAAQLGRTLASRNTLWASGHWGWQWYATQDGFREVDVSSSILRPGDYFVIADDVDHQPLKTRPSMHVMRVDEQKASLLNIFCTGPTVGLYLSTAWTVPWSLRPDCLGRVTVFQVSGNPRQKPSTSNPGARRPG